ncbi:MAG: hypothetical protein KBA53_09785 [Thermoclostridium sp.]|nr:hypothetical protein [Thermoclostridium sp.]
MKREKNDKNDFIDDGRVIADMNIDGMPGFMFKRKSFSKDNVNKKQAETISNDDRRTIAKAIASSYILFGVVFFGLLALFILFCTKVWFK